MASHCPVSSDIGSAPHTRISARGGSSPPAVERVKKSTHTANSSSFPRKRESRGGARKNLRWFSCGNGRLDSRFRGNDEVLLADCWLSLRRLFRVPAVIVRGVQFLHTLGGWVHGQNLSAKPFSLIRFAHTDAMRTVAYPTLGQRIAPSDRATYRLPITGSHIPPARIWCVNRPATSIGSVCCRNFGQRQAGDPSVAYDSAVAGSGQNREQTGRTETRDSDGNGETPPVSARAGWPPGRGPSNFLHVRRRPGQAANQRAASQPHTNLT